MRLSQEEFLTRSVAKWGERWDYSETNYTKMTDKITLICPEHGVFTQFPQAHLKGLVGCSKCNGQEPITTEEFIRRAEKKHPKLFDYSLVFLGPGGIHQKVSIKCKNHNQVFTINAWSFLNGVVGCSECNPFSKMTKEKFLKKVKEVYPEKSYDYSKVEWGASVKEKVTIGCPVVGHGVFQQSLEGHLAGKEGCPLCNKNNRLMTVEEFIKKSRLVWGEKYDYSTAFLTREGTKVKAVLKCPEHGEFQYGVNQHLTGYEGCVNCRRKFGPSRLEQEVAEYVKGLDVEVVRNDREILEGLEIDIYIPELKIAIEVNGLYYHSEKFREPMYHYEKFIKASQAGVKLLQVWEDDWRDREVIVKRHLRHVLNKSVEKRVFARSCQVQEVSSKVAREFLENNHIQGFVGASVHLALLTEGEVVALSSFKKNGEDYLLSRYATSVTVVGGHSKLVKAFENSYNYGKLVTFADLTFGDGALYRSTGWVEDGVLPPNYSYLVNGERRHKFGYRLKRFKTDPDLLFKERLTERELAKLNGLERVWDAGKIRFIRSKPAF